MKWLLFQIFNTLQEQKKKKKPNTVGEQHY